MTISVATYNVYLGADLLKVLAADSPKRLQDLGAEVFADVLSTDFATRARGIVSQLDDAGWPDLVGLQEVSRWSTATDTGEVVVSDFTAELVAAFAEAGAPYALVASAANFGGRLPISPEEYGGLLSHNVTFARRDRVRVQAVRGGPFTSRLELPTHLAGVSFDVVRSWTVTSAEIDATRIEFANTHLETYDAEIRAAQLLELVGLLEPGPALIVGDFNEHPEALVLPSEWADAWVVAHGPAGGFTFEEADPLLRHSDRRLDQRLDYVMTRGLRVHGCDVIGQDRPTPSGLWPSDHAGVVAVLGWDPRPIASD